MVLTFSSRVDPLVYHRNNLLRVNIPVPCDVLDGLERERERERDSQSDRPTKGQNLSKGWEDSRWGKHRNMLSYYHGDQRPLTNTLWDGVTLGLFYRASHAILE